MSTTLDNRVVEMQFDNKHFEQNVATSMGTLDKLKKSLNLDGATKGLNGLSGAAKGVDMSPIGKAAETVGLKFNAMYTIADQALRNITSSAMNYGKRIVSALTLDPIKTGFNEYETKIGSIQTIMSNTASKGTTMADVTRVIDELNTYADKTIYNFTEMTRNIGTFTAAGVGLEESASAIQGIANLAAASGSTSQQASTAMYQLSQALAAGTVKLMDWNSVVNAGMGGEKFQEALKATARDHGIHVDELIEKNGSFRESLQEGWISADILNETLNKFTVDGAKNYSKSMVDSGKWTEEQAKALVKEAQAMEDAATKVKTFTQLWDTMKESAQSGWGKTWELIVGDFEDAKELWTGVSNVLGGMIEESANARNDMLEGALTSNWEKLTKEINKAGIETQDFEAKVKSVAKGKGEDVDALVEKYGSLENVFKKGALSSDILKEALGKMGESMVDLSGVTQTLKEGMKGDDVKQIEKALTSLGYTLTGKDGKNYGEDGYFGELTRDAIKAFQELNGLKVTGIVDDETLSALREATTETNEVSDSITGLIDKVTELGGREKLLLAFKRVFLGFKNIIKPVTEAFREIFPRTTSEQITKLIDGFLELSTSFGLFIAGAKGQDVIKNITSFFKGMFSAIDIGIDLVVSLGKGIFKLLGNLGGFAKGIIAAGGSLGTWITDLRNSIKETNFFENAIDRFVSFLSKGIKGIESFFSAFNIKITAPVFDKVFSAVQNIWEFVKKFTSGIKDAFSDVFSADNVASGLDILNSGLFAGILLGFNKFIKGMSDVLDGAGGMLENISDILGSVKDSIEVWQQDIRAGTLLKIAGAIGILAVSLMLIASIDEGKLTSSLWAVGGLFAEMMGSLKLFATMDLDLKGITKATFSMIGMATALLILSAALKNLSSLDWGGLIKGFVGVSGLMYALSIFMNKTDFSDKSGKSVKTALGIVILATSMKILASACKDFGQMDWGEIGKGLVSISGLLLAVSIFSKLTSSASGLAVSTGTSLILIGVSMKIFASAFKDISNISWDGLIKSLYGMTGALLAIVLAMRTMPDNMASSGLSLVAAAAALLILAKAMDSVDDMSWDGISRGLVAIGLAMVILVGGLNAMTGTLAGAAALLVAAGALAVLTPILMILGSMSLATIGKGLLAIAGAFAIIGIAGIVLGPLVPVILGLAAAFALIGKGVLTAGVGLTLLAVGITALATACAAGSAAIIGAFVMIGEGIGEAIVAFCKSIANSSEALADAFKTVLLSLTGVIGECLVGLLDQLATYAPAIVDKILVFLIDLINGLAARAPELTQAITNLITSVFGGLVDAIGSLDFSTIVKTTVGFGLVIGIMALLGAISPLIPGAMVGLLGMAALVVELGALVAVIGLLAQIPGLDWLVNEGGEFLQSIGTALGKFVGGLAGGVAEGFTSSLPQIGSDLSAFMTNLQPFLDGASTINASAMDGVNSIVDIILKLTAAELLEGLTSWVTGGSSIADFAGEMVTLGEAITTLSTTLSEVSADDIAKIDSVAGAIESMVAVADKIPETGGLAQAITGAPDLVTFAGGLTELGTAVSSFTTSVTEVTPDDLVKIGSIAGAVDSIVTLAGKIPETGGLVQAIAGAPDISSFAGEMTTLGTSIATFCGSVAEVTETDISKITSIGNAASALVGVASSLEGYDDSSWFNTNLTEFAGEMVTFGTKIKEYAEIVNGVDLSSSVFVAARMRSFLNLAISISEAEGATDSLVGFAANLVAVGIKLVNFYTTIADIDTTKLLNMANSLTALASIDVSSADTLQSFINSLGDVATTGIDSFANAISDGAAKIPSAVSNMIGKFIEGVKSESEQVSSAFEELIDTMVNSANGYYDDFSSAGGYVVEGFASGITANTFKAEAAAVAMAMAAKEAAEDALGIKSPARAMIAPGKFTTEGFAKGIMSGISIVYNAGLTTAEYAKEGFSSALSSLSDLVSGDIDSEPTIRPVLDLSDVSAGANKINGMLSMSPSIGAMANVTAISSMMSRRQNGPNGDVVSAINDLGKLLGGTTGPVTNNYVNGVNYSNDNAVGEAIGILVRAATMEGRA